GLLEDALELARDRLVLERHQPRQQLDQRHLTAEAIEDRRELDADRAAAHDRDRLGHDRQVNRLVAGDDAGAIDGDPGHAARARSGGDDDLPRGVLLRRAAVDGDLDGALADQASGALDPLDLVLLEQQLDAAGEALDDLVLAGVDLREIEADAAL